jgi:hypothetical protein
MFDIEHEYFLEDEFQNECKQQHRRQSQQIKFSLNIRAIN